MKLSQKVFKFLMDNKVISVDSMIDDLGFGKNLRLKMSDSEVISVYLDKLFGKELEEYDSELQHAELKLQSVQRQIEEEKETMKLDRKKMENEFELKQMENKKEKDKLQLEYQYVIEDLKKSLDLDNGESKKELIKTKLENEMLKEQLKFYKDQITSQKEDTKEAFKANNTALIAAVSKAPVQQTNTKQ